MTTARILLAHDDPGFGRTLSWILTEHEYQVAPCEADADVVARLDAETTDLLVLETATGPAGLDLLRLIKQEERFEDLPVLLLSPLPEEDAVEALSLGAADILTPPFRTREILARIKAQLRATRALNRARAEARSRSELVGILREIASSLTPAEIFQVLVRRVAQGLGISKCSVLLREAADPAVATVMAAYENPELRNLAVELPRYPEIARAFDEGTVVLSDSIDSDPLFTRTRQTWMAEGRTVETTSALAIPFTLQDGRAGVFYLRTTGADAVLNQLDVQFAEQVIRAALTTLEKAYQLQEVVEGHRKLREQAETDPLTGLLNRRAFEQRLTRELEHAGVYHTVLSCLMIDVDHFKETNDRFGHQVGDVVLTQLAALLRREQRAIDVVARLGGEEFCILLPLTGTGGARILAERILRRVAGNRFGEPGVPVDVTVSIGIATWPDEQEGDGLSLLRLADEQLLKAKSDGRNRYRDAAP